MAFLASDSSGEHTEAVWFVYYKDTRDQGGRLKMGCGPGGPPYLYVTDVLDLMVQMVRKDCLDADQVIEAMRNAERAASAPEAASDHFEATNPDFRA